MGCDNVLESGAQTDACGVCNGDGSGTTKISDTLTGSGGFGYHTVTVIPAGAIDVRIAEATVTPSVYIGKQVALCRYTLATYIYVATVMYFCFYMYTF